MIDTHCHIDDPQYVADFDAFIRSQQEAGVKRILVPGINIDSLTSIANVCYRYPDLLIPAVGLHPEEVKDDFREQLNGIKRALDEGLPTPDGTRLHPVAVGEIGLDYHWDITYKSEQQEALRTQFQWAVERNLPVMIHNRDATADTLAMVRQFPALRGVFHCFNGSVEVATELIQRGFYLGIGGVLTFKNCHLKDTLQHVPLTALLLETDAPYMAPVPHRGKRNESRFMIHQVDMLADIYNTTPDGIIRVTTDNACRLFALN